MKYPKISILVAAYRSENVIEDTLNHFLKKVKYPNFEVIFGVDTKEDRTIDIVRRHAKKSKKIIVDFSERRRGIVKTMNSMLKKATGDIIIKFDAEFRFLNPSTCLYKLIKYYKNPKVGALTFRIVDPPNKYRNFERLAVAQSVIVKIVCDWRKEKYPVIKDFFPMPLFIHSFRNVIKKIEKSSINDDAELAYKILDEKFEIRFADNIKAYALREPGKFRKVFYRQRRTTAGWFITKKRRKLSLRLYALSLLKYYLLNIRKYGLYSMICLIYFGLIYSISIFGALLKRKTKITKIWKR